MCRRGCKLHGVLGTPSELAILFSLWSSGARSGSVAEWLASTVAWRPEIRPDSTIHHNTGSTCAEVEMHDSWSACNGGLSTQFGCCGCGDLQRGTHDPGVNRKSVCQLSLSGERVQDRSEPWESPPVRSSRFGWLPEGWLSCHRQDLERPAFPAAGEQVLSPAGWDHCHWRL